jgi:hypothetical protein
MDNLNKFLGSIAKMSATEALRGVTAILARFGVGGQVLAIITHLIGTAMIAAGATAIELVLAVMGVVTFVGIAFAAMDWIMGQQGLDMEYEPGRPMPIYVAPPTVERQSGVWTVDARICGNVTVECMLQAITGSHPRG